ncbi:hypothetical protein D3218_07825 [Aureimonas flava]|uniref:Uncharacterized protein n=2 Tax=Aureimonas flava TaxID=2320271 RepID=A0A3A1WJE7_9HYPH|nr:hypothetical protein D3218_07825 [Aureimonas flava]
MGEFADGLRRHLGAAPSVDASGVEARERPERLAALLAEDGRLRRAARRNAPSYDLNRHIAVRRLIALGGVAARPA